MDDQYDSLVGNGPAGTRLRGIKCSLVSLGCAKNLVDSETMLGLIATEGGEVTPKPEEADVIIVNTCGFITDAKQESIDAVLEMALKKRDGRCKALVVAGCLSQRHGAEVALHIAEADAVIGIGQIPHVVDVICRVLEGNRVLELAVSDFLYDFPAPRMLSTGASMAYVKVSDGCSNRCTFCTIPAIRGGHRSRPMESVVSEVQALVARGIREIVLIAQDTTRYGEDIYGHSALPELLCRLADGRGGLPWVRVMYMHPARVDRELLEVIASHPSICPYVDMPLQHAHPDILAAMNRSGSPDSILELVAKVRSIVPGVTLRTTFIVGFPGETEEHFRVLRQLVQDAQFDRAGIFEYSREAGTPAYKLPGQVPKRVKRSRRDELMRIQQDVSLGRNLARVGAQTAVILEGPCEHIPSSWYGRSQAEAPEVDGKIILSVEGLAGGPPVPGMLVLAQIRGALHYDLQGEALRVIE